jgi:hypothetical protein
MLSRCGCRTQVTVDNFDLGIGPTEINGSLSQSILELQAFLIAQDLMGTGLADV